jgi:hypothetical protein
MIAPSAKNVPGLMVESLVLPNSFQAISFGGG